MSEEQVMVTIESTVVQSKFWVCLLCGDNLSADPATVNNHSAEHMCDNFTNRQQNIFKCILLLRKELTSNIHNNNNVPKRFVKNMQCMQPPHRRH